MGHDERAKVEEESRGSPRRKTLNEKGSARTYRPRKRPSKSMSGIGIGIGGGGGLRDNVKGRNIGRGMMTGPLIDDSSSDDDIYEDHGDRLVVDKENGNPIDINITPQFPVR